MKELLSLERYVLSNLLYESWTKVTDKKIKNLQKYVYKNLYDKKLIEQHVKFLKESLQEFKEKCSKIKHESEFIDDRDNLKEIRPSVELEMLSEHIILKLLNKLSESDLMKQKHFENKSSFKYLAVNYYFLPPTSETYLLESSRKKDTDSKVQEFKRIIVNLLS